MVSGQWSGMTTMLSSFCVKIGVVSDQFQFANEFHDEKARILRLNEVLYCRCLITNNNEHSINLESDHIMMQSR